MELLSTPALDDISPCPYLEDKEKRYENFFARSLSEADIASFLAKGWRKFGIHFFRPACPGCLDCVPLRVLTKEFYPSKSQRRVLKKCSEVDVRFGPPRFSDRIYQIFEEHSAERFSQASDLEGFLTSFYLPACPGLQSEYYIGGELLGVGFLDRGTDCLSSVYFAFDPKYSDYGLGTFSVLKEVEHAKSLGLNYYYLGYYVPGCSRMTYKNRFTPREVFNWDAYDWVEATG